MKRRRVAGWLAAPIAALALLLLPLPPRTVEVYYSRGAYRWCQAWITRLSNLAPFALLDLFFLLLVLLIAWRGTRLVALYRQARLVAVWEALRRVTRVAGIAATMFFLMWGLNYRRVPIGSDVPRDARPTVDDLREVIAEANTVAARFRPAATADRLSFAAVTGGLRDPLNNALARLNRPPLETTGRPKVSWLLTPFFTRAGVDGMIDPFALETIVHPDLLPFERPFTLGHEWGHLSGVGDEAEGSAVGWLACMSGPPELVYSGVVFLIVEAGAAVPPAVWRDVSGRLDPGVREDLASLAQRQARQQPAVQRTAFRVYDTYLRANRVEEGLASYSRALSLILAPPLRDALSSYRARPATGADGSPGRRHSGAPTDLTRTAR